jgi:hypothetical protein
MRIYVIGNDGITLCREAPATVNEGEVAVASNEELHAAPLSGKRLLALWNALPGVEKRRKVGDRKALIDQLRAASGVGQTCFDRHSPNSRVREAVVSETPPNCPVNDRQDCCRWSCEGEGVIPG